MTHKPTIAAEFEREMCCTSAELLAWLPGAARGCELRPVPDGVDVQLPSAGWLQLRWHTLAPRRIALITLPRLAVRFRFENVSAEARASFMRYFDLYTQRGGG